MPKLPIQNKKTVKGLSRPLKEVQRILDFDLIKEINTSLAHDNKLSILDLGCGVGRSLWELSERFSAPNISLNLLGVYKNKRRFFPSDKYYENLLRMKQVRKDPLLVPKEFNINFEGKTVPKYFNVDACKRLPFESNSIDLIYSTHAFHYFRDKIKALQEISRILKPNGRAILYLDRGDDGFWPNEIHYPRLRIYKNGHFLNFEEYFANATEGKLQVSFRRVYSKKDELDAYVMEFKKINNTAINIKNLVFSQRKSTSLDSIRSNDAPLEAIPQFLKLRDKFKKPPSKEYFGGYLSCYNLKV